MPGVAELFERAMRAHHGGDLETAEEKYRSILASNPDHAPTLSNLGMLLARTNPDVGYALAPKAVSARAMISAGMPSRTKGAFRIQHSTMRCATVPASAASSRVVR